MAVAAGLLAALEILGRLLYPIGRESRGAREARRDHRRGLSYLGPNGDPRPLLQDVYVMEKRYLPLLGWLSAPNVRLSTIATNADGFRDRTIEPRQPGEYRILITGASFAWGLGASGNAQTVAGQLESLLNRREATGRCRVMNGAFLNWCSGQEYVVVTEYFDSFDPDLVISLTGYNDLVALCKDAETDTREAQLLAQAVTDQLQPMGSLRALRKLAGTLGVWRLVVLLREELAARAPPPRRTYRYDTEAAPARVERVVQRYLAIADFLGRKGRQYLIALEPEIYSTRKALCIEEFDLKSRFLEMDVDIAPTLMRYRHDLGVRLAALAGGHIRFLDLAGVFDPEVEPVFIDYNHVCDRGYRLVAGALDQLLAEPGAR